MRVFLACLLMSGCVLKRGPIPEDTKFDESKRDWIAVYQKELEIAIDNEDKEARYFFLQEIIKMKYKMEYDMDLPPNPRIKILNE